ncbi:hypothetical protein [Ottowia sp. VDI28]|uniref:hypothetical protein n=1 Tax=Ottowia sp. VDI28 TaxID=3133968 RepID=UPI003C2FF5ED
MGLSPIQEGNESVEHTQENPSACVLQSGAKLMVGGAWSGALAGLLPGAKNLEPYLKIIKKSNPDKDLHHVLDGVL